MAPFRMLSLALGSFLLSGALAAQTTPKRTGPPPEIARTMAYVQKSLAAQTGGAPINDVTLVGAITLAGGQNSGAGAITLSATVDGKSQVSMNLPSGRQSEVRNYSRFSHAATWTGPDGAAHDFSPLNTLGPHPAWFFPAFVMQSGFNSTQYFAGDLGPATWDGASVEHLSIFRRPRSDRAAGSFVNPFLKQVSQYEIYLNPSTLLPEAITFNVHLDSNHPAEFLVPAGTPTGDFLEEIRYLDYREVQGRPVAFHIQVLFNGALSADIQLASANFDREAATAAAQ